MKDRNSYDRKRREADLRHRLRSFGMLVFNAAQGDIEPLCDYLLLSDKPLSEEDQRTLVPLIRLLPRHTRGKPKGSIKADPVHQAECLVAYYVWDETKRVLARNKRSRLAKARLDTDAGCPAAARRDTWPGPVLTPGD